jgi:hypothetical protein
MHRSVGRFLSRSGASAIALSVVAFTVVSSDASPSPTRLQTVRIEVVGSGVVRSGSVRCKSVCRLRVRSGSIVRLAASPGQHFDSVVWTSGCVGSAPSCIVVADRDGTVRAQFQRKLDRLTISVGGPGIVTSTPSRLFCGENHTICSGDFPEEKPVRLQVFPNAATDTVLWNKACGSNTSCTIVARPSTSVIVAVHVPGSPTDVGNRFLHVDALNVNVTSTPPGISCNPSPTSRCTALFPWHSLVKLTGATRWGEDCVGESPDCWLYLDSDSVSNVAAVGHFLLARNSVSLILSVSPHSHGLVLGRELRSGRKFRCGYRAKAGCNPGFPVNSVVVLTGQPARSFGGWAGFCQGRKASCRLPMGKTKTVLAYFKRKR